MTVAVEPTIYATEADARRAMARELVHARVDLSDSPAAGDVIDLAGPYRYKHGWILINPAVTSARGGRPFSKSAERALAKHNAAHGPRVGGGKSKGGGGRFDGGVGRTKGGNRPTRQGVGGGRQASRGVEAARAKRDAGDYAGARQELAKAAPPQHGTPERRAFTDGARLGLKHGEQQVTGGGDAGHADAFDAASAKSAHPDHFANGYMQGANAGGKRGQARSDRETAAARAAAVPPKPKRKRSALEMEYHNARTEQEQRMEAAGIRPGTPEEKSFYRHPDAPQMDGSEERVTYRRFLERKAAERRGEADAKRRWVEGQQAGARLGFRHAYSGRQGSDEEWNAAAKGHDEDAFTDGYSTGLRAGAVAQEKASADVNRRNEAGRVGLEDAHRQSSAAAARRRAESPEGMAAMSARARAEKAARQDRSRRQGQTPNALDYNTLPSGKVRPGSESNMRNLDGSALRAVADDPSHSPRMRGLARAEMNRRDRGDVKPAEERLRSLSDAKLRELAAAPLPPNISPKAQQRLKRSLTREITRRERGGKQGTPEPIPSDGNGRYAHPIGDRPSEASKAREAGASLDRSSPLEERRAHLAGMVGADGSLSPAARAEGRRLGLHPTPQRGGRTFEWNPVAGSAESETVRNGKRANMERMAGGLTDAELDKEIHRTGGSKEAVQVAKAEKEKRRQARLAQSAKSGQNGGMTTTAPHATANAATGEVSSNGRPLTGPDARRVSAARASEQANKSGDYQDHEKARGEHRNLAELARRRGDAQAAKDHNETADHHAEMAARRKPWNQIPNDYKGADANGNRTVMHGSARGTTISTWLGPDGKGGKARGKAAAGAKGTARERSQARRVLENRYGPGVTVTEAMIDAVLEGLAQARK